MENPNRLLLLTTALCATLLLSGCSLLRWPWFGKNRNVEQQQTEEQAAAEEEAEDADATPPRVIEPNVARRKIKTPKIDNENWEIGAGAGFVSIEDFGTNSSYAGQISYHVTEDFFFRADIGQSTAGKTSFETLGGDIELLTGNQRRFTYYSLSLGYNFLPGEVFLGRKLAMNSGFYLLGGIGSVKFAGDNRLTVNLGAGFRVLPTDWLAIHLGVQDRVFNSDLLGEDKVTNNIEMLLSATVFF
ncbi:MAG TPA: outer membrane beta-barrel domain-containing protein [Steroidobacteraceae bacterium]|jgi:outer membrane beta-barrel protein|nr:outer membrane beta-barrel domain-containing protein [Steroidobacteraceae bacterium]